ncbi:hypothetical protein [Hymenobacter tenuis]
MNLRTGLFGFALLGAAIWLYASQMPVYKNGKTIQEVFSHYHQLGSYQEMKAAFYKNENALRTNRNELLDVGSGIAVASLTLLAFVIGKRLRTVTQLRQLGVPSKRQFFIWLNAGWVVLFADLLWYYHYRAVRGDFPPFADSIAIPVMYGTVGLLACWPVLNLVLLLVLRPAKLSGQLFEVPSVYTGRAILTEVLCGIGLVLVGWYAIIVVLDGDHLTIPVVLLFLYLVLVVRAGYMWALNQKYNSHSSFSEITEAS